MTIIYMHLFHVSFKENKDKNFKVSEYVITFTVKPSTFSNLDPVSSYDVRFLCNLYGRKARAESYNFRVETFSKIGPETVPN